MKALRHFFVRLDTAGTAWVSRLPRRTRGLWVFLSFVGQPLAIGLVAGLMVVGAAWLEPTQTLAATATALLLLPLSSGLKHAFRRLRPATAANLGLHNYSFPSGHTFGSTLILGLLALLACGSLPGGLGCVVAAGLGLMIVGIGLSRVYLGAHYPSDVLGGWLIGGALLAFIGGVIL